WVLLLMYGALLLLWSLATNTGFIKVGGNGVNLLGRSTSFSAIWVSVTHYASYVVMIPSIFIIISITNEYQYRTNRQNVIDGWNRLQFYHAKWQLVLTLALITVFFTLLLVLLLGIFLGVPFSGIGDGSERLFYLLLLTINYYGFSLLLGV